MVKVSGLKPNKVRSTAGKSIYSIVSSFFFFDRLEQKIKDLETQLDDEQRRLVDAQKSQRRTDRRIKELTFSQDEDHKNHERMQELVDKLQNKVKWEVENKCSDRGMGSET